MLGGRPEEEEQVQMLLMETEKHQETGKPLFPRQGIVFPFMPAEGVKPGQKARVMCLFSSTSKDARVEQHPLSCFSVAVFHGGDEGQEMRHL